jgi:hypothetical protein
MKNTPKVLITGILLGAGATALFIGGNAISAARQAEISQISAATDIAPVSTNLENTDMPTTPAVDTPKSQADEAPAQSSSSSAAANVPNKKEFQSAQAEQQKNTEVQNPVYISPRPENKYNIGDRVKVSCVFGEVSELNPGLTAEECKAIHGKYGNVTQSFAGEFRYMVSVEAQVVKMPEHLLFK